MPRVDAVSLKVESQRGAERVDDGGKLAAKGASLRKALSDRSVRAYADPRHARLDVALARFPVCVEINQCVGCTREFFTESFLGDDACVLAIDATPDRAVKF